MNLKGMKNRLLAAWFCNLIDTISTLYLCGNNYAEELNPLMRILLQQPFAFIIVKVTLMTWVLHWLWRERASKYAVIGSYIACILYGTLALYCCILLIMLC